MSRFSDLLEGAAGVAGLVVSGLCVVLAVGGLGYRKECVNDRGTGIKKEWTTTLSQPIPYLLRPSEDGCTVHSGTSVALDFVGIAKFEPTTVEGLGGKLADNPAVSAETAYLARLAGAAATYRRQVRESEQSKDIEGVFRGQEEMTSKVHALTPPPRFHEDHQLMARSLNRQSERLPKLRAALKSGDRDRFTELAGDDAADQQELIKTYDHMREKARTAP